MGGHWRFGGRHNGGRGRRGFGQPPAFASSGGRPLGRPKPILWVIVIFGVALWSLGAWVAYTLADPFFGWVAASAGLLGDGAKGAATVAGAGSIAGNLDVSGFFGQTIAFFQAVAKPATLLVWAIGALGLLSAPFTIPWIVPLLGRLRYH